LGRLESTFRYSPGRPGWVPLFGRLWSWWPLLSRPSVGSPVAPDVDPERHDKHGCGGEVEDGAEDSFYAFIQGHVFPPPLSNFVGLWFGRFALRVQGRVWGLVGGYDCLGGEGWLAGIPAQINRQIYIPMPLEWRLLRG